ncbi:hypothetical protein V8E53_015742 [Lactarius tabidus]
MPVNCGNGSIQLPSEETSNMKTTRDSQSPSPQNEEPELPSWPIKTDQETRAYWESYLRVSSGWVRADEWGQEVRLDAKL